MFQNIYSGQQPNQNQTSIKPHFPCLWCAINRTTFTKNILQTFTLPTEMYVRDYRDGQDECDCQLPPTSLKLIKTSSRVSFFFQVEFFSQKRAPVTHASWSIMNTFINVEQNRMFGLLEEFNHPHNVKKKRQFSVNNFNISSMQAASAVIKRGSKTAGVTFPVITFYGSFSAALFPGRILYIFSRGVGWCFYDTLMQAMPGEQQRHLIMHCYWARNSPCCILFQPLSYTRRQQLCAEIKQIIPGTVSDCGPSKTFYLVI